MGSSLSYSSAQRSFLISLWPVAHSEYRSLGSSRAVSFSPMVNYRKMTPLIRPGVATRQAGPIAPTL